MPLQPDNSFLTPLTAKKPPAVPIDSLIAVGTVHLAARDTPRALLRQFYEGIAGLTYIPSESQDIHFRQRQRRIVLEHDRTDLGRVAFLIRQFDDALLKLRDLGIPTETLHTDGGLTRMAIARDPAGNWVHLVETRAF